MSGYNVAPLENLVEQFERMPGIGNKTAQRLAYYVLNLSKTEAEQLAGAVMDAHTKIHYCSKCCNLTDKDLCPVCANPARDHSVICAVDANGFSFLLASLPTGVGLPEAKRVYSQLALRAETPVVVSFPDADARQRKALVAQGIPFVCPGRQAFLPFMGTACTERGSVRFRNHATKMSPNAQAAAIWGAAQEPYRPYDLCRALGISASRASEAITELVDRGLARRERRKRRVVVFPVAVDVVGSSPTRGAQ